jgi:hypothetical protein
VIEKEKSFIAPPSRVHEMRYSVTERNCVTEAVLGEKGFAHASLPVGG